MKNEPGHSPSNQKDSFLREQNKWKIPGIILSLIILTVSIAGIFVTYFYTGPQQLKYGYIDA
ncbi:MAG: hypothetical protein ACQEP7_03335, partial [bacterium]